MKKKYLLLALLAFGSIAGVQAQRKRVSPYSAQLTEHYNHVDSKQAALVANKPLIGISLGYGTKNSVNSVYVESVLRNGGVPYLLPVTDDVELLRQIMAELDGIILTGGEDITPFFYGEEKHPKLEDLNSKRDLYDLTLFKLATDRNVPVLGICRGLQLINVAMGGTLYQDIPTEHPSEVNHRPGHSEVAHDVNLVSGSVVSELMGQSRIQVNSKHHQGIEKLAPGLKVTGWSPDSIPEIVGRWPS